MLPETKVVHEYVVPPTSDESPIDVGNPLQIVGALLVGVTTGFGLTTTDVDPDVKLVQPFTVTVAV